MFSAKALVPMTDYSLYIIETENDDGKQREQLDHRDHFTKPIPCLAPRILINMILPIRMENKMARLNGSAKAGINTVSESAMMFINAALPKILNQKIQPVDNIAGNIPKAAST